MIFLLPLTHVVPYISSGVYSINLHIRPGQLVGIVGQVGAGKSSLLSCLLGEMEKACGSVKIRVSDYKQYKELVTFLFF